MRYPPVITLLLLCSMILFAVACGDDDPTTPVVDPPAVTTGDADSIEELSATLNGMVDTRGADTVYWFEYGTDESYDNTTPEASLDGCSCGELAVSAAITDLDPGTFYQYRLVARNAAGTSQGENVQFSTAIPNRLPDTQMVAAPTDTTEGVVSWHLYWTGSDVDGEVVGFELRIADHGPDGSLDPADSLGVPWTWTVVTDSVVTWPDDLGLRTAFVRAVDNRDGRDPTPAQRVSQP